MCNRIDTIPACVGRTDRQTDGQTSCHGIVRAMRTRRAVKRTVRKGEKGRGKEEKGDKELAGRRRWKSVHLTFTGFTGPWITRFEFHCPSATPQNVTNL